jgi:two-component system sensor histidine kinase HydH
MGEGAVIAHFDAKVQALFEQRYHALAFRYDRLLTRLMLAQWVVSILFAWWFSPYAWAGKDSVIHSHVIAAILLGGAITALPAFMFWRYPGHRTTRHIIATGMVLWSALLIHLTGGRIETHFHVFISLAVLAFYRDAKVLIAPTIVVALDHFIRGMYFPESVYGVVHAEWWRFLEHAWWVVFLDAFLVYHCVQSWLELRRYCEQQVALEEATSTAARLEKLAAVGQLAAGVGHELRNPLAAVRNAHAFIRKRLIASGPVDAKVDQFLGIVDRELDASNKIIANLLEFSRPKEPVRSPCPLHPLVEDAIAIVPPRPAVMIVNAVPRDMPIPDLDKDQFRQVLVNLVQNASESIPDGRQGLVSVTAEKVDGRPWQIYVEDNGSGIPPDVVDKIFQPLFSTKVKGTGLGLAVVAVMVERHHGRLHVETVPDEGTRFRIELPETASSRASGGAAA